MKDKIKEELLDELLKDYKSPEDLIGPEGLLTELKKRLINKVLDAELTTHLGYGIKVGTASFPTAPSQIPACGFPAQGSSQRRAVQSSGVYI